MRTEKKETMKQILISSIFLVGYWLGAEIRSDAGAPFGELPLVQEINCAAENPAVRFSEHPAGVSKVEKILGKDFRTLPNDGNDCKYFAYRIGEKKGLKAGQAYLLCVEFPDDLPRSVFVCNWGCETVLGMHSATTVGDALSGKYTNSNPESLQVPQSGEIMQWRQFFHLYDRFPEIRRARGLEKRPLLPDDGFWLIFAQYGKNKDPLSVGAAVLKIRLFELRDSQNLKLKINYPPDGLPKRRIFFREEMADGVISYGHKPEEQNPESRGIADRVKFYEYKVRMMEFLGLNTFCKDLLEFGHNQGWDSEIYGGSRWYNQSADPGFWERIIGMLEKHPDLAVLPYYEYAGSIGQDRDLAIGSQHRCQTLGGGKDYTHINWVHKTNADLADPDFIEDAKKLLDATIVRYKDRVNFVGAWFRPRPEANPISFNKKDLEIFSKDKCDGKTISIETLRTDKKMLDAYYSWWFLKRRDFNVALRDYLRAKVNPESTMIYTCDSSEGGISIPASIVGKGQSEPWRWKRALVTDQVEKWTAFLGDKKEFSSLKAVPYKNVVEENLYLDSLLKTPDTYGKYEWQNACPKNDPENYRDMDGVMLSYSFNKLFTVSSEKALDAFRTRSGLMIARHYFLNENEMDSGKNDILGYFVADVERSGPHCMLAEARALANGNPSHIGYLLGNSFSRGFPEYVRSFNSAFLSLPALPGTLCKDACEDPEVALLKIPTEKHGTYFALINTGLSMKKSLRVKIPVAGKLVETTSGKELESSDGSIYFESLYSGQVIALNVKQYSTFLGNASNK